MHYFYICFFVYWLLLTFFYGIDVKGGRRRMNNIWKDEEAVNSLYCDEGLLYIKGTETSLTERST